MYWSPRNLCCNFLFLLRGKGELYVCFDFDELASLGRSGGLIGVCTGDPTAANETAMRLLLLLLLPTVMLGMLESSLWGGLTAEEAENVEGDGSATSWSAIIIDVGCGTLTLIDAGVSVVEDIICGGFAPLQGTELTGKNRGKSAAVELKICTASCPSF